MPGPSGWQDKLYWRRAGKYHCFKKVSNPHGYQSLCGQEEIKKSGGQGIRRPPSVLRCGLCDGKEMDRRGWVESGETSKDWRLYE